MINLAVFIPAQERNKYHKLGDLAPFGDTTLLQWKISQCKDIVNANQIYISSTSENIRNIAQKEGVNYINRSNDCVPLDNQIQKLALDINKDLILWTNATSPFLGKAEYVNMLNNFLSIGNCELLISTVERKEYVFFKNKKLNFNRKMISRADISPVSICTNGAYLIDRKAIIKRTSIMDIENIHLHNLDFISSVEIKDIVDYSIAQNLISVYFSRSFKDLDE